LSGNTPSRDIDMASRASFAGQDTYKRQVGGQSGSNGDGQEELTAARYCQSPPLLFTADYHPIWLGNTYRGRSAFLVCGGPSFAQIDHARLRQPGIVTMGVNNSVKTFRPNLWVSVDGPDHFLRSTWLDATIMKFVPISHLECRLFNSDTWRWLDTRVCECPNVFYFRRNAHFQPAQFLWEDTLNWGNHKKFGGGRSVMLPAIRLLFYLGIRRVFLLGADFKMDPTHKYHFEQDRSRSSIRGNTATYQKLNRWFGQLRSQFARAGFEVVNCNMESRLRAFDFMPFDAALNRALDEWGCIDVKNERAVGLYDLRKDQLEGAPIRSNQDVRARSCVGASSADSIARLEEAKLKTYVVVLGGYRCGTSCISGTLSELGVDFGECRQGNRFNARGFFEHKLWQRLLIRQFNEATGEQLVPDEECCELLRGWRDSLSKSANRLVGMKHPLLCLLGTHLERSLPVGTMRFVAIDRRIEEIVQSLKKCRWATMRNADFATLTAKVLATRDSFLQDRSHIRVDFDELLDNTPAVVERIARYLEIDISATQRSSAIAFVNRSLAHRNLSLGP
jgi:hypothetical protein